MMRSLVMLGSSKARTNLEREQAAIAIQKKQEKIDNLEQEKAGLRTAIENARLAQ